MRALSKVVHPFFVYFFLIIESLMGWFPGQPVGRRPRSITGRVFVFTGAQRRSDERKRLMKQLKALLRACKRVPKTTKLLILYRTHRKMVGCFLFFLFFASKLDALSV